jgi:signal peptidase I
MKKIFIYVLFFIALLVVLWFVGNTTKIFARYRSPTRANEPTIKEGSGFFVSSLRKPKRFDFICLRMEAPQTGKHLAAFRLCGIEGDLVEIKNGDLYVNNKFADSLFTLSHTYMISVNDFKDPKELEQFDPDYSVNATNDSAIINISDALANNSFPKAVRLNIKADEPNEAIRDKFGKAWNADNFGPVTVPVGHYFVLGDNRHLAADSRYAGFIPASDFVATVLWKK